MYRSSYKPYRTFHSQQRSPSDCQLFDHFHHLDERWRDLTLFQIFKRYGCHLVRAPQREMKRIIFILESLLKLIKYQVIKKLAQSSWMKKSNFSCDESNLGSYMKISGFSCKFMRSSTSDSVN